ncbi:MAG: UDP-glucuronic acid decarboxylase family protein [Actinomycetota bacterium]
MTRALVTGGAGFVGSHLCRRLLDEGWQVICVDSLITGRQDNVADLRERDGFRFEQADVRDGIPVDDDLDWVLHLASPASPIDYLEHPIETLESGAFGTLNALRLAKDRGARFFVASTSEVYGDPEVHPQPETYWGNVNPIGPRSVYDEAKRFGEAATMAFRRVHGLPVRIVRIFNTYGPQMRRGDGRAVPTFIEQALANEPITVHGDGTQTRSLCYVDDLVEGFRRLMESDVEDPVNIGNPEELTMRQLAETIRDLIGSSSEIEYVERPTDDPGRRRPDIGRARELLGWEPTVPLAEGLKLTLEWARDAWRS